MPFSPKSNRQASFLHALKGDQAKGLPPVAGPMTAPMAGGMKLPMAPPSPNPMMKLPMPPNPVAAPHIPQAPAPSFKPPMQQPMGNPNVPGLGGGAKLPKFGKMRSSLKSGPFKK